MKKKIATKQPNERQIQFGNPYSQNTLKPAHSKKPQKSLFQFNYELISQTINEAMNKPTFSNTINKILLRQPSMQLIFFQEIQKNLVLKEYLEKYHRFDKIPAKMKSLIPQQLPNVKANYMDFKIQNYLILNKYKVAQRVNLPYPLCIKFQKLTDSKMSSTKSVQNKVLNELEKQFTSQNLIKKHDFEQKNKKNLKVRNLNTERFEIKILTKDISQMIQNIKDERALQNFKKEMEKSSQFKFKVVNFQEKESKFLKNQVKKQILKIPKKFVEPYELKERQFKRKVEEEMGNFFLTENKSSDTMKKLKSQLNLNLPLRKRQKDRKFSFKSTQRLKTSIDPDIEEYGLSVIREKRRKSRSKQQKSKSKHGGNSKSKHFCHKFTLNLNKRLETQYSSSSNQRLNTWYSMLTKSKSNSRIPTEYDSTIIVKGAKSKSKSKNDEKMISNLYKNESKSSSISSKVAVGFKRSQSKPKINLIKFSFPNRQLKK